jgi:1-acyl-sn-glycerol-3-phosphate acyltransferase
MDRTKEITLAREYVNNELPLLIARRGLNGHLAIAFQRLFVESFNAATEIFKQSPEDAPYVDALPVSRQFFSLLGETLVGDRVQVAGLEQVARALEFMNEGGNVLLVSNHTSGADTLVLHHVVNNRFHNAAHQWLHMAGHVVNLYLLPLVVTGGVRRVQIFSARYCQETQDPKALREMKAKNAQALSSIGPMISGGGQCVVLYPEGGRGDGALKKAEPRTMKIPQLMDMVSPAGLMILPSYVEATDILPVVRTPNEFSEFLSYARPGNSMISFGPGVMWQELQPNDAEVHAYLTRHAGECLGNPDHALKRCLVDKTMHLIADMAPTEISKGPYA